MTLEQMNSCKTYGDHLVVFCERREAWRSATRHAEKHARARACVTKAKNHFPARSRIFLGDGAHCMLCCQKDFFIWRCVCSIVYDAWYTIRRSFCFKFMWHHAKVDLIALCSMILNVNFYERKNLKIDLFKLSTKAWSIFLNMLNLKQYIVLCNFSLAFNFHFKLFVKD